MRKINLQVSKKTISLNIPVIGSANPKSALVELFKTIENIATLVFLFLLPFGFVFTLTSLNFPKFVNQNQESALFVFILTYVILMLLVILARVLYEGRSILQDPKGLLVTLIFSLLLTTSAVLQPIPSAVNTFGSIGPDATKVFAGVSIMVFLGIYYIFYRRFSSTQSIKTALRFLGAGTLFLMLVSRLDLSFFYQNQFILGSLCIILFANIFIFKGLERNIWLALENLYFLGLILTPVSNYSLFVLGFSLILPVSVFGYFYLKAHPEQLVNRIKNIKNALKNIRLVIFRKKKFKIGLIGSVLDSITSLGVALLPVVIIVFTLVLLLGDPLVWPAFQSSISRISGAITSISNEGFLTLLIGNGASQASSLDTFFSGIIRTTGLVGVAGYILIFTYIITVFYRNFLKKIKTSYKKFDDFAIDALLFSFVTAYMVQSLLSYSGILFAVLFWMFYGISLRRFSNNKIIESATTPDSRTFALKFGNKKIKINSQIVRLLILALIVLMFVISINYIFSMRGAIF